MKRMRHLLALGVGLAMCSALCVCTQAESYDIGQSSVQIFHADGGQMVTYAGQTRGDEAPVITGKSTENTLQIVSEKGQRLHVSIENLNVDVSAKQEAPALSVSGDGSVVLTLLGNSALKSGLMHAGIEVHDAALYILGNSDGILNAVGGQFGAGIGGGANESGSHITIAGGNVNAVGGVFGAGIGGGQFGAGSFISILGGQVSVKGGMKAAGIGGGWGGTASDISLLGGRLNAYGVRAVGSGEAGDAAVRMDVIPVAGSMQVSDSNGALFTADVGERVALDVKSELLITDGFDAEEGFIPTAPAEETEKPAETVPEETKPAETKPAETVPEETKPAETKPAETIPEETKPVETKPAETKPEEIKAEESKSEQPQPSVSAYKSLCVKDADGKSYSFTAERNDGALDIVSEQKGADLYITAADLQAMKDEGLYILRLNFGGQRARVTIASVAKWMDASAKNTSIHLLPSGGAVLMKNGTSYWIY